MEPTTPLAPEVPDKFTICLHVFNPTQKTSRLPDFKKAVSLLTEIAKSDGADPKAAESQAKAFAKSLSEARLSVQASFDGVSNQGIDTQLTQYISLLLRLIAFRNVSNAAIDDKLDAAELGGAGSQPASAATDKLLQSLFFTWTESIGQSGGQSTQQDAMFELASVTLAASLHKMQEASRAAKAARTGATPEVAAVAYKQLREAAGLLEYLQTLPQPSKPSADLNNQVLQSLHKLTIADAQSITLVRAIQKGNNPTLIAALAADVCDQYRQSLQCLRTAGTTNPSLKLQRYLEYKAAVFSQVTYAFTGLSKLREQQAGAGLRCLKEAEGLEFQITRFGRAYDAVEPATSDVDRHYFERELRQVMGTIRKKVQRENETVFFQPLPTDLPAAPAPRRLTDSIPFTPPPPALLAGPVPTVVVEEHGQSGDGATAVLTPPQPVTASATASSPPKAGPHGTTASSGPDQGGSDSEYHPGCCGWLVYIIVLPLLLLISLLGLVVWIILLPLKIICCPIGCAAQMAWNVFEALVKAPLHGLLWASGDPHWFRPEPWQQDAAPHKEHS